MIEREDKTVLNLFAGNFPRVELPVIIIEGSKLIKGTVIGIISESGKCAAYDPDGEDGTDKARFILAEDVDATSGDVKSFAYASGEFNESALTGLDTGAIADFLGTPIFIKKIF